MAPYAVKMRKIYLVVGSKHEYYHYSRRIKERTGQITVWTQGAEQLPLSSPVVFVAGTGHNFKYYADICETAHMRGGTVVQYGAPGLFVAPSLEIAHVFAEQLGIDPKWRC